MVAVITKGKNRMKKYHLIHDGLVFTATVYAKSPREAVKKYREAHGLEGKRLNMKAWQADGNGAVKASGDFYNANYGW